jgi:hypothetical protein
MNRRPTGSYQEMGWCETNMDSGATLWLVEKHLSRNLAPTDQIHSQSAPEFQSTRYPEEAVGIPAQRCVLQTAQ